MRISPTTAAVFLLPALLVVVGATVFGGTPPDTDAGGAAMQFESADRCDTPGCATAPSSDRVVERASACRDSGYLCTVADPASAGTRIRRWADDHGVIHVSIGQPGHEPGPRADSLMRAAVRGVLRWHGQPFPIRVHDRSGVRPSRTDVRVVWAPQLDGTSLGRTRTRWVSTGSTGSLTSAELQLGTFSPYTRTVPLTPAQVELVAAHEMGHALGLLHSDDPGDLMYPRNTADRITPRDYRTLHALYALPNGALIPRHPERVGSLR